jgi:magnesium chelatase family protein
MLAARLLTILRRLRPAELLEVSMIASVAGEIEDGALSNRPRPYQPVASTAIYSMFSGFNQTGHTANFICSRLIG